MHIAAISASEKLERAQAFVFSVESDEASFESLAVSVIERHRILDANFADALLKISKGDLARHLDVMNESLAKRGVVFAGHQILFLMYKKCGKQRRASAGLHVILAS